MRTRCFITVSLGVLFVLAAVASSAYAGPKTGFEAFIVGNPADAPPTWTGTGGVAYTLNVNNGLITSTQAGGNIY